MAKKTITRFLYYFFIGAGVFFIFIYFRNQSNFRYAQIGLRELKAGNFNKASIYFSKYLDFTAFENKAALKCRVNLGLAFWNLDKLKESEEQFSKAEELAKKLRSTKEQKFCQTALLIHDLYSRGREFYFKGELDKSLELYRYGVEKARDIKSDDHELKITKVWSIALLNKPGSREFLKIGQRALLLAQAIHHRGDIVVMLNNIGTFYSIINEHYDALIYHLKSIQEAKDINETKGLISALSNASGDYIALGNFRKAFESVSEALALAKTVGFEKINTDLLMNMGSVFSLKASATGDADDYDRAIRCFQESLKIFQRTGDYNSIRHSLLEIGEAYIHLHKYDEARFFIDTCLDLNIPKSDRLIIAQLWNNRGALDLSSGDYPKAESAFERALEIGRLINSAASCFRSYYGLARCSEKRGRDDLALEYYSKAIEYIRQIGSNINNDIDRAYFIQNKTDVYQSYVHFCYRLLRDRHDDRYGRELFAVMEMAKARSFIEFIERRKIGIDLSPPSIEELQNRLIDSKSAVLEYFLSESASYLLLLAKSTFRIYTLPSRSDVAKSVSGFLHYCEDPKTSRPLGENAASRLFKELLSSAYTDFPLSVEHLIIIPDGILFRLPFETLILENENSGIKRYLIEIYSVSYAPSATALKIFHDQPRPDNYLEDLLAIGDPEYPEPILMNSIPNTKTDIIQKFFLESGIFISPLPNSREEVKEIAALFRSDKRKTYLGNAAQESILKNLDPAGFKIIHIACHAISDDIDPYKSAIVFSLPGANGEDGFLQLREMYDLKLKSDLVVLSACQTAKGQIITNEGVLGLPRVFFYAGAFSVVSSLWNAEDKATAQFMKYFYQELIDRQSKAQALRLAKIEFIKSKYSHPFYWGTFILTGDFSSRIH